MRLDGFLQRASEKLMNRTFSKACALSKNEKMRKGEK